MKIFFLIFCLCLKSLPIFFFNIKVDGDSQLVNGNFVNMKEVQKEEIINTALLYGFSESNIDEAIKECSKNEPLNIDKVLNWLNLHCNQ